MTFNLFPLKDKGGGYYIQHRFWDDDGTECTCGHFIKDVYIVVHASDLCLPFKVGSSCILRMSSSDTYGEKMLYTYLGNTQKDAELKLRQKFDALSALVKTKKIFIDNKRYWKALMFGSVWDLVNHRVSKSESIAADREEVSSYLDHLARKGGYEVTKETDLL